MQTVKPLVEDGKKKYFCKLRYGSLVRLKIARFVFTFFGDHKIKIYL